MAYIINFTIYIILALRYAFIQVLIPVQKFWTYYGMEKSLVPTGNQTMIPRSCSSYPSRYDGYVTPMTSYDGVPACDHTVSLS